MAIGTAGCSGIIIKLGHYPTNGKINNIIVEQKYLTMLWKNVVGSSGTCTNKDHVEICQVTN